MLWIFALLKSAFLANSSRVIDDAASLNIWHHRVLRNRAELDFASPWFVM